jgi:hypothetical protein
MDKNVTVVGCAYHPSFLKKLKRRALGPGQHGQKGNPISKIPRAKD